ncbi:MAG: hypothetical protein QOF36_2620 [Microbacteriaceae bacterium]|jgi:hypothetical protein|nr:hypothetical protein [Microbacteriaceae bacterium]
MIDRETLHPMLARALAADKHDADERGMEWDPHAAATVALDALERMEANDLLEAMGVVPPGRDGRLLMLDLIREECQFESSGPRRPALLEAAHALDPTGETAQYVEQNAYPHEKENQDV